MRKILADVQVVSDYPLERLPVHRGFYYYDIDRNILQHAFKKSIVIDLDLSNKTHNIKLLAKQKPHKLRVGGIFRPVKSLSGTLAAVGMYYIVLEARRSEDDIIKDFLLAYAYG